MLAVKFLLFVILAAVLYSGGEAWGPWMRRFGRRLAGPRGERMVVLASQAIRGVALGVVVTAILQTVLSGLGLPIVGVPFAAVLTAFILVLCIAQIGPILCCWRRPRGPTRTLAQAGAPSCWSGRWSSA